MPLPKLRKFLDSHHIKYLGILPSLAYTAQGVAALVHVSGKQLAKTVIVKVDGILAIVVLPASRHVDLGRLRKLTGARIVELATEGEFKDAFPDCELGAMPPFGNLYGMPVYADVTLAEYEETTYRGYASRISTHEMGGHAPSGEPDCARLLRQRTGGGATAYFRPTAMMCELAPRTEGSRSIFRTTASSRSR